MYAGVPDYRRIGKIYGASSFVVTLGNTVINNIFVVLLADMKGYSVFQISLIIGLTPLLILPFTGMWGKLLDKSKRLICYSRWIQLANILTILILLAISNFTWFFVLNFLRSFIMLPSSSISEEYLLNLVQKGNAEYGKLRMQGTLGYAAAGLLAPVVLTFSGVGGLIVAGAVLVGIACIFYRFLPEIIEGVKNSPEKEQAPAVKKENLLRNTDFMVFLIVSVSIFGTLTSAANFGTQSMLLAMDCPTELIGTLPAILVVCEVGLLFFMDSVDMKGKEYGVALVCCILCMIRWGVMAASDSYIFVIAACAIHGIVSGIMLGLENRMTGLLVPEQQRSTAFLVVTVGSFTIVPSILNMIIGALIDSVGTSVFGIVYFMGMIPGVLLAFMKAKEEISCRVRKRAKTNRNKMEYGRE